MIKRRDAQRHWGRELWGLRSHIRSTEKETCQDFPRLSAASAVSRQVPEWPASEGPGLPLFTSIVSSLSRCWCRPCTSDVHHKFLRRPMIHKVIKSEDCFSRFVLNQREKRPRAIVLGEYKFYRRRCARHRDFGHGGHGLRLNTCLRAQCAGEVRLSVQVMTK